MNRQPIFDAVRGLLASPLTQAQVDTLDAAISQAEGSIPATSTPQPEAGARHRWACARQAGADLIQSFEGCEKKRPDGSFDAYPDPGTGGDPWTIGWGATGPGIKKGVVFTKAQCDARFAEDMKRYATAVSNAIGNAPTTQNQFDAMVSFHYNTGAIAKAALTKKHIARDYGAPPPNSRAGTRRAGACWPAWSVGARRRRPSTANHRAAPYPRRLCSSLLAAFLAGAARRQRLSSPCGTRPARSGGRSC
jgi:GH24 family phage-related lysozyme (muramidase)